MIVKHCLIVFIVLHLWFIVMEIFLLSGSNERLLFDINVRFQVQDSVLPSWFPVVFQSKKIFLLSFPKPLNLFLCSGQSRLGQENMQCLITVSSQLQVPLHIYLLAFCITYSQLLFSQASLSHLVEAYEKVLQMSEDFPYVLISAISRRQTCLHMNFEVKYNFGYFFLACLHGGWHLFILCSATDKTVLVLCFILEKLNFLWNLPG